MIETLGSLVLTAGYDLGELRSDSLENPRTPFSRVFDIEPSWTGKRVTELSSLQVSTVWACIRILSGAVAKTPLNTYRRAGTGKHLAPDHYLYELLKHRANPFMSAFRFKRLMQTWALLWGNAYAEMVISGRGQVIELWPWRPDRVRVTTSGNDLVYTYQMESGDHITRASSHIFHLRGSVETDGHVGLSPIQQARQSIGLSLAAEEFGAKFFQNNGRPGMVLQHPGKLSDLSRKNLVEGWENIHKGLQGAHRMGVLEEGMKVQEISIPLEDAQFLATRKFGAIDICRLYGVPPHKVAELDKATFSNIEHQGLEFVNDSLGDWFANWESEITMTMLSDRERQTVMVGFDPSNLLRGDLQSTALALASLRQNGFINADEGRERIGENPIGKEAGGEKYLVQLNMQDMVNVGTENDPNIAAINADPADTVDTTGVSQEK